MQWVCNIAMFMIMSGIVLELIADSKYYKFARWVAGVILLMQFIKPLASSEELWSRFWSKFNSFDYALGTDRILEEIYYEEARIENSVLTAYKERIAEQIGMLLEKSGLRAVSTEISVAEDGAIEKLWIRAAYLDGTEKKESGIPTVAPIRIGEVKQKKTVSPLELYIREMLAGFYQIEQEKIEVIIQEAE